MIARLILIAVLAAFAASSVAHAAGITPIAASMVDADQASMNMADCPECGSRDADGKGIVCAFACASCGVATLLAPDADNAVGGTLEGAVARTLCGITSPPAKLPPRTLT